MINYRQRARQIYAGSNVHEWSAEVEKLCNEARAEAVGALKDLLDQIESLQWYELTRDVEHYKAQACWDDAVMRAGKIVQQASAEIEVDAD